MTGAATVVFSFGMGVDSAAIIREWTANPASRDFGLDQVVLVTAMTGDEYPATEAAMTRHVLPLLRRHCIRYVQVARAGQAASAGYEVLSDTRTPERMHMRGTRWRLSDELRAAGTVPQVAHGRRLCSHRAKGEVLDRWIADEVSAGRVAPGFRHVIGFAADEQRRAQRDTGYTQNSRHPCYPLITWGWDRAHCLQVLQEAFGITWPRSCCLYCPFQCSAGSMDDLTDRWRATPDAGAEALAVEFTALALNPRMGLFGERTAHDLVAERGLTESASRAAARRDDPSVLWSVHEVRRIFDARKNDPARKGISWRSVALAGSGTRDRAASVLRMLAARHGTQVVTDRFGIDRVWLRRPAPGCYPAVEHFYVLAPAGVAAKERPGFRGRWQSATELHPAPAG